MLRAGMPIVETRLTVKDGKIAELALAQTPAQPSLSGPSPWPMRTQVMIAPAEGAPRLIPVTLTSTITRVPEARGLPAPRFVFPNAGDYGYFISLLDSTSAGSLEHGALGTVSDGLLRTMLWGALWDQVRAARLDPARFAELVLREAPDERDEQIVPSLLGRLERALKAYLPEARSAPLRPRAETMLWTIAGNVTRHYGVRRAALDAFIGLASTGAARASLKTLLTADSAAGEPVRDPTRWNVVERLLVLGDPSAGSALATQTARDTTPDGKRRAYIVGAGRPDAAVKARYFRQ